MNIIKLEEELKTEINSAIAEAEAIIGKPVVEIVLSIDRSGASIVVDEVFIIT